MAERRTPGVGHATDDGVAQIAGVGQERFVSEVKRAAGRRSSHPLAPRCGRTGATISTPSSLSRAAALAVSNWRRLGTQGNLDAYSQRGGALNDRGVFLLHPAAMKIAPGKSETIVWRLFWHKGWDDFFSKLGATNGFVRLTGC